jgi:DNA-binding MarR family transcriptional regulator
LPPELQFLRALWHLDHALASASRRMKAAAGVTGRERLFIRLVGRHPGITPGELADLLHVHPSSVTALVKRLQGRRLLSRRLDAEDARSVRLALTAGGERVAALESGTIEAGVKQALAGADPRAVEAATQLLARVARRLAGAAARARRVAR